ncbi:MAG TPA: hypothetical protein VFV93_02510 [Thermomicrobiales bacterium]|nr:hypothetical protein [Thermomicrobiales bacterium]
MGGTATAPEIERYRPKLQAEIDGAALYRVLSDMDGSAELAKVYDRLATTEAGHATYW